MTLLTPAPIPLSLSPTNPVPCDRCGARTDITQTCAPCGDDLCSDCYSPWTALACGRCRLAS